ncbi:hypothetical protein ACFLT9_08340 [Acidobacteriota bacterium]
MKRQDKIDKKKDLDSNRSIKSNRQENPEDPDSLENSTTYIKNKKTGEWEIKNPAGSTAYNIIGRDIFPED